MRSLKSLRTESIGIPAESRRDGIFVVVGCGLPEICYNQKTVEHNGFRVASWRFLNLRKSLMNNTLENKERIMRQFRLRSGLVCAWPCRIRKRVYTRDVRYDTD